jgi:hypothetical protein
MSRLLVLLSALLSFSSVCYADGYRDNTIRDRLKGALNNTLYTRRIREHIDHNSISYTSVSERDNHGCSFVLKPLPYGLVMTFRTQNNNTNEREKTSVVFKRLFSFVPQSSTNTNYTNGTKYNLIQLNSNTIGDINCVAYSTYKTCNISTLDNSFWVSVDYASEVFQKGVKYVFPTDVKVTVGINMPSIPSNHVVGLVTSFKTGNGRLEERDDELYTDDKRVVTGSLTYFSFETYATDNNGDIVDVGMNTVTRNSTDETDDDDNSDDNSNTYEWFKVFTFSSTTGISYILWDPMIGATTTTNNGQTSTSSSALSGGQIAGIVVGSVLGALVIVAVAVVFAKRHSRVSA